MSTFIKLWATLLMVAFVSSGCSTPSSNGPLQLLRSADCEARMVRAGLTLDLDCPRIAELLVRTPKAQKYMIICIEHRRLSMTPGRISGPQGSHSDLQVGGQEAKLIVQALEASRHEMSPDEANDTAILIDGLLGREIGIERGWKRFGTGLKPKKLKAWVRS